jgi:hypothetical protein
MPKKSYVEVKERTPFGEDVDPEIMTQGHRGVTYIEGYSDVRQQRELAMRDGKKMPPLKHRLQWARAKSSDNASAKHARVQHWEMDQGYTPLAYDEAVELGYRVDRNRAITKGPDGLAYLGDQVLMMAGQTVAAANYVKVQRAQDEQNTRAETQLQDAVERFNVSAKGASAQAFSFVGAEEKPKRK